MFRLQIISFFLVLVLSVQIIPLRQIGVALVANQWTEEPPHGVEKGENEDGISMSESLYLPITQPKYLSHFREIASDAYLHIGEQIPCNHSTDIVSPPPDLHLPIV